MPDVKEQTDTDSIIEWLEDFGCNREPFTDSHKDCQCRKAHKAATLIEQLRKRIGDLETSLQIALGCALSGDVPWTPDVVRRLEEARALLGETL